MGKKKPRRLGRGLDSLLGDDIDLLSDLAQPPSDIEGVQQINTSLIVAGKYQPRHTIEQTAIEELSESIKEQGIIQPILVRIEKSASKVKRYEIIAGERRYRAAKLAGLREIPAIIRDVTDQQAAVMALIENIQREDLNPLEEAQGIKRLLEEFNLTHEAAAQAIGRSRSATTNLLRLLNLETKVQDLVANGGLDMGHARALLSIEGSQQILAAEEIIQKDLSVREAERLVSRIKEKKKPRENKKTKKSADIKRFESTLSDYLGTTVQLKVGAKNKGQLLISFQDWEHLHALLEKQGLGKLFKE